MIDFKKIDITDREIINSCLYENTFRACDYCFSNLFAWQSMYRTRFAIKDNTLFIRFQDLENNFYYMMPIGDMPLNNALSMIIEDAEQNNIMFRMKGITQRMSLCIEKAMPNTFKYMHDSENDEYIYFTQRLIDLKGKKLQSKRNYINRFKSSYPNWTYSSIKSENELNECLTMLDKWKEINIDKEDKTFEYDYLASRVMINNFHYLQLKGGFIRLNGEIIAFTMGEQLTNDTLVIHIEKAFDEITGSYTIINQQFAQHEAGNYTYINREEDMGIENLRKAKMSYQPAIVLKENIVSLK
jgi:hypothetical protein